MKTVLLIAAFVLLIYLCFKGFNKLANDELSDYDSGMGKYEDSIDND